MALLPVADALARLLDGVEAGAPQTVPLGEAAGRVLAADLPALRTQPPFDASAMDGYAVRAGDMAALPAILDVIGEAPAGKPFAGSVGPGQAVRIFTGAPVPEGADTVVIQENAEAEGNRVRITARTPEGRNIRLKGLDFAEGDMLLEKGRLLDPAAVSLAAAGNHAALAVVRRPLVAIVATGDELMPPGGDPGPGQIVASNGYGVAAIAREAGAEVLDLGIAPDTAEAISGLVDTALAARADVVVTLGGASVGDHDLVHAVLTGKGMALDFWKIAMRPGKPLMFGRLEGTRCLGLPGNPVASLVCAHLFLKPLVACLSGRSWTPQLLRATLETPMEANDQRQDYVRAVATPSEDGLSVRPFGLQDSSMLRTMAASNALIVREPFSPPAPEGSTVSVIMLR